MSFTIHNLIVNEILYFIISSSWKYNNWNLKITQLISFTPLCYDVYTTYICLIKISHELDLYLSDKGAINQSLSVKVSSKFMIWDAHCSALNHEWVSHCSALCHGCQLQLPNANPHTHLYLNLNFTKCYPLALEFSIVIKMKIKIFFFFFFLRRSRPDIQSAVTGGSGAGGGSSFTKVEVPD